MKVEPHFQQHLYTFPSTSSILDAASRSDPIPIFFSTSPVMFICSGSNVNPRGTDGKDGKCGAGLSIKVFRISIPRRVTYTLNSSIKGKVTEGVWNVL